MNRILVVVFLFAISSCKDNKPSAINESGKNLAGFTQDSVYRLIDKALNSGDSKSYNRASHYFFIRDKYEEFLYPALIMANKYENPEAHYHVFQILNGVRNQGSLILLDSVTKNYALYHLIKSHELGYSDSKYALLEIYPNGGIPSSTLFCNVGPGSYQR